MLGSPIIKTNTTSGYTPTIRSSSKRGTFNASVPQKDQIQKPHPPIYKANIADTPHRPKIGKRDPSSIKMTSNTILNSNAPRNNGISSIRSPNTTTTSTNTENQPNSNPGYRPLISNSYVTTNRINHVNTMNTNQETTTTSTSNNVNRISNSINNSTLPPIRVNASTSTNAGSVSVNGNISLTRNNSNSNNTTTSNSANRGPIRSNTRPPTPYIRSNNTMAFSDSEDDTDESILIDSNSYRNGMRMNTNLDRELSRNSFDDPEAIPNRVPFDNGIRESRPTNNIIRPQASPFGSRQPESENLPNNNHTSAPVREDSHRIIFLIDQANSSVQVRVNTFGPVRLLESLLGLNGLMRVFAADDDPSEDDMIAQIIHHILSHFINARNEEANRPRGLTEEQLELIPTITYKRKTKTEESSNEE